MHAGLVDVGENANREEMNRTKNIVVFTHKTNPAHDVSTTSRREFGIKISDGGIDCQPDWATTIVAERIEIVRAPEETIQTNVSMHSM